jgi:hypothetical protein
MQKVGDSKERVDNLYFLYSLLLGSLNKVKHKLKEYSIVSDNI